ncbi:hypothetical protein [Marinifilum fragile]|uniref:hypothetical protein n=1 Tax=Marinifilum fragile TaxID=570161 RepID=UPI002AA8A546|nr:hypothetical protein [Marinifilum fragile]
MELLTKFIDEAKIDSKEFYEYILDVDNSELSEFIKVLNDIISESYSSKSKHSNFSFITNDTLSGHSFPCSEVECKLGNVDTLIRNAILYADKVYIQNPFETYYEYKEFNENLRLEIIGDLIVLNKIKPLLKEGIFEYATTKVHFCSECYKKFEDKYLKTLYSNIKTIEPYLLQHLQSNIDFYAHWKYDTIGVEIIDKSDLLSHSQVVNFVEYVPDAINKVAVKGKSVKLSKSEVEKSGVLYYLLNHIEKNLHFQDYYSAYYNCHLLTDRNFDIELLKLVNNDVYEKHTKESEILKNLDHMVPFIDSVPINKLLKLRKEEGESFEVYRDKLSKLIQVKNLSSKESKQLFNEEIRPEINKMNLTLSNNKKVVWGNIKSNIFLASTYISATLFAGILPANIDKIVASVGGFGFAKNIGQDVLSLLKNQEIRKNEFYFLWKIQKDNKIKI